MILRAIRFAGFWQPALPIEWEIMKCWISTALLLAACGCLQAADRSGDHANIAAYLDGRRFVSRLDADVTGDGVPDAIFVAADDRNFTATVTVLMRMHGKPVTGKGIMEGFQGIDSLTVELSPFGPPTLRVVKGVLIIDSLVGGSTVRTASTYRYRFDADEGRMRLIGLDAERTSTTFGIKLSWNAFTGAHVARRGPREGTTVRYGPESRTTYKPGTIYMSLTPAPDELLDRTPGQK